MSPKPGLSSRIKVESSRLYPSAPIFARELIEDTIICGYPIPKGTTCLVEVFHLHRDEDVFPNPEVFDPDRFLPENSIHRHSFAYVPFSAGPRNCIVHSLPIYTAGHRKCNTLKEARK
ncbi:cytochrome P450 4V2 [Trichonephila clavata]|uniref:Cytochrome P450 4V2 n=1 Tax=Trichonephila clavata TaxID=2740835 RepID=A0A8X6KK94_TRICU|nr:cytochrome P450 4V2 [Trichonephila clavata]